ncbi:phosphoglycerate kinase [Patescibacteria group bacterium]|nr:phosphoglycerate kinase [Patescibacteria group bacterium]MCL5409986.1 phosphoglycerate kinase [Patescibacteria group bacterium]
MRIVTASFVHDKKVLLRMDLDVPLEEEDGKLVVQEDFRLQAALPTLKLCLENAQKVIVMGHLGRPDGQPVPKLSVEPIYDWLYQHTPHQYLDQDKLFLLENLRFEAGEDQADLQFAKELASFGDVFVNEAFAAHHPAASTTILPTLVPSVAGLHFAQEIEKLTQIRQHPQHPLVAIIGGVKIEDKLPAVLALAKVADAVLVGGKIADDLRKQDKIPSNVFAGKLTDDGQDLAAETVSAWSSLILGAKEIFWNGPLGKVEDPKNFQTHAIAKLILESQAESIIGGGDTITALNEWSLLNKFSFVSTGGGAMLKFIIDGALPTITALK